MSPPRHIINPESTNITMKLAGLWSGAVAFAAAVVWVTVLVYDIRSDIRQLNSEIRTRQHHARFASQLARDTRPLNLIVRAYADGPSATNMP